MLDLRTMYVATAAISLSLGLLQLAASYVRPRDRWLRWWGASSLLIGAGLTASAMVGHIPNKLAVMGGNLVTAAGGVLLVLAVRSLAGKPVRPLPAALALAAIEAAVIWLGDRPEDFTVRVGLLSAICAACDLAIVAEGVALARREHLASAWALTGLFALTALSFLGRTVLSLAGALGDSLTSQGLHPAIAILAAVMITLRAMTLLLVAAERAHKAWERAALHDPLTGVLNRAGLTAVLDRRRLARPGAPMSVLVIDIDRFKAVNDQEGHDAGDGVLRLVAEVALGQLRATDIVARQGGDEFVVVLPATDEEGARATAERIRARFETAAAELHADLRPTLSIGVAEAPLAGLDLQALLNRADRALYASKNAGRNTVSAAA